MRAPTFVPIVDLFSGPGGLAEGFAGLRGPRGHPRFRVALSVEKDRDAHRTLRLRTFLRKFGTQFPSEYYDFLNGEMGEEPDWRTLYPRQWREACNETQRLELGAPGTTQFLQRRIMEIRARHGERTVLLGGPPCQSYSVIGRVRNAGKRGYNADKDVRQSLYEEYAQVLHQLRPAVAVMENVRGMLSARRNGKPVFPEVVRSLQNSDGGEEYRLFTLTPASGGSDMASPDFLVHAARHGVPQSRHRVIIICVRRDLAERLPDKHLPRLADWNNLVPVQDVIGSMPKLRSRLSQGDSPGAWQRALKEACGLVEGHKPSEMRPGQEARFHEALRNARSSTEGTPLPWSSVRGETDLPASCPDELRNWLFDENINRLPNNDTRGHMSADLTRYLFAGVFAHTFGRSPKSVDFPEKFAPNHASWRTGKFVDRYRVQLPDQPSTTVVSHISKDGHYFIHPDPSQCRSLTVREAARLQTFPDNYFFCGGRTSQYIQVGNAVPPFLAYQIAEKLWDMLSHYDRRPRRLRRSPARFQSERSTQAPRVPLAAMEST